MRSAGRPMATAITMPPASAGDRQGRPRSRRSTGPAGCRPPWPHAHDRRTAPRLTLPPHPVRITSERPTIPHTHAKAMSTTVLGAALQARNPPTSGEHQRGREPRAARTTGRSRTAAGSGRTRGALPAVAGAPARLGRPPLHQQRAEDHDEEHER